MIHSKEDKALLMVDRHSSHANVNVLSVAKEYDIVMACPPPHSTHQPQPLDLSFCGQLKTYYSKDVSKWLEASPGRSVKQYQISFFCTAYRKAAAAVADAASGLKNGIRPVNADTSADFLFAAAEPTDKPIPKLNEYQHSNPRPRKDVPYSPCTF
jgi:hypothetical protein